MIRLYYDRVKGKVVSYQIDEDVEDILLQSNTSLVPVPEEFSEALERESLEEYMNTYDPQNPDPIPVPKSALYYQGKDLNEALAEYFSDEDWHVKTGGTDTGAQIITKIDNEIGTSWKTSTLTATAIIQLLDTELGTGWRTSGGSEPAPDPTPVNNPPVINNQNLSAIQNTPLTITLGPLVDVDGDTLTYTVTGSSDYASGAQANRGIFNTSTLGTQTLNVTADDGNGGTDTSVVVVTTYDSLVSNNYILEEETDQTVITVDYGAGAPNKLAPFVDPTTGTYVTRMTDASTDMQQTPTDAVNGYSRWTQENSDGTKLISFGTNSTSSTILDTATGNPIAYLAYNDSGEDIRTLGMAHEMRWDKTGNFPNRIYYVQGTTFNHIDVTQNNNVDRSNPSRTLIRDFATDITWPAAANGQVKKIYNDQEGDCSLDSDHWAFMAAYYDGTTFQVAAILHYQISTDTLHTLYPSDLAGTNMDAFKDDDAFPKRPNMVEISPLGTGVVIHTGRSYAGWNESTIGTWFDGAHLWPLDFDHATEEPLKISISETHSGWAFAEDGRELFVYQDNRRDVLSATYISGANKGYALGSNATVGDDAGPGTIDFANHANLSYTGFHFAQMPLSCKGWILVSTYSNGAEEWADHQLFMMQIKDIGTENPKIWRIGRMYNFYQGDYWDEATASINLAGNRIYVTNNWGTPSGNLDIYRYELPANWSEYLNDPVALGLQPQTLQVPQHVNGSLTLGLANNADGDPVTYTIAEAGDYTINGNILTYKSATVGNNTFTVTASHGGKAVATTTITVDVVTAVYGSDIISNIIEVQ
jgi:hypothetical protein